MTKPAIVKTKLYAQDFLAWIDDISHKLRARDFDNLDLENLMSKIYLAAKFF